MKIFKEAILPKGFKANGIASGVKRSHKLDLALFYTHKPAKAACKFTTNKICAAPVKLNKKHLKGNKYFQAIIVNSGNANCFTGKLGLKDAEETVRTLARALNIKNERVLVNSTGIIGKRLPLLKIKKAIPELAAGLSSRGISKAKKAIMTTDTFAKEITVKFSIGKKAITICGVAKGAGMIAPHMATMLAFLFTDADITESALKKALDICVESSFNSISIDGCMSTNDTVAILANADAGNKAIDTGGHFNLFTRALGVVCLELAKMIVRDAEGATKFIQIRVDGARDFYEARTVALNIANSNLFKTAVYGQNHNFGRIVAAVGVSGVDIKEEGLRIRVSPLNKKEIEVYVYINRGKAGAVVYTSDLTPEYIKINAGYN